MTDRELVEKAKAGDQSAFEQLVLDNQNKVFSLALRLVHDREEAADLAQEAFVKAWQGLVSFQGESSFATWIYRLTTNVCIDHLRKQKRREEVAPAVSLDDEETGWAPTGRAIPSCCWRSQSGAGPWPGGWKSCPTGSGGRWSSGSCPG